METFWETIGNYNRATWIWQLIIILAGAVIVVRSKLKPTVKNKLLLDGYMGFISLWVALVYYGIFCQDREYHVMFAIFWGMLALLWLLDFKADKIAIRRMKEHVVMGNIF
ncbi:MAG: hypothetical protein K2M12_03220, partial [Muribaculaceae bacterium]|nr:hypothetical protein [Muribaculaceae bacterium]